MSSRNIDITAEQAAALLPLLPLLQSIISQPRSNQPATTPIGILASCTRTDASPEASSSVENPLSIGDENMFGDSDNAYRLEDLLTKKKKNFKFTMAQNFLHILLAIAIAMIFIKL